METDVLPYVIFLIVPLLGRMSDSNEDVRNLATTTFASIIKLVPLEAGIADPKGLPEELVASRERERDFIQQMMDPSKAKPFKLPIAIKATLRKYQQDGVNWLAFLNKYQKPGIFNMKDRYKWEAWENLKGKSQEDAEKEYIALVDQLIAKYSS